MRIEDLLTPTPPAAEGETPPLKERLKWFVLLMAGGVVTVAIAAYALRAILLLAS